MTKRETNALPTCHICGTTTAEHASLCSAFGHPAEREQRTDYPKLVDARPLADWHEDHGPVTWWVFPLSEPAWIGTPLDSDWPGYHTHWTPHPEYPRKIQEPLAERRTGGNRTDSAKAAAAEAPVPSSAGSSRICPERVAQKP